MQEEIPMIAIGGGPCAGKTTYLSFVKEKLSDFNLMVFLLPETATILINSGFDPRIFKGEEELLKIQEAIFNTQLNLEEQWTDTVNKLRCHLNNKQKPVIICDRGIKDIEDYLPIRCAGYFETLAKCRSHNTADLMNKYKGVIHLVTAADGAEQFYTLENNQARRETAEEARIVDKRIQNCWVGHPHLKVIDNSTGFESKMKRALATTCRFLDIPVPMEIERKFLVKEISRSKMPQHQKIEIEQFYLNSTEGEELRLRKRGYDGSFFYFLTRKKGTSDPMVRHETERMIPHYEFLALSKNYDPSKKVIIKERICFLYKFQYFELDFFRKPDRLKDLILLEIELTEQNDKVEIPGWIKIEKEVTDDPTYSNFSLASKD